MKSDDARYFLICNVSDRLSLNSTASSFSFSWLVAWGWSPLFICPNAASCSAGRIRYYDECAPECWNPFMSRSAYPPTNCHRSLETENFSR